ncbi:MAG: DNA translocase FtsK [Candidatus Peribacteraceae bacterium]|nr:DNA translocase FtsK [Candidatus Peribacteraceae bacterium]MBP9850368.1 DNA translocase FtsK [Candidatus Peribacteraceae bacterium]
MPKRRRKTKARRTKRRSKKSDLNLDLDLEDHTRRQVKAVIAIGIGMVLFLAPGPMGLMVTKGLTFFMGSWHTLFPTVLILFGCLLMIGNSPNIELKRSVGLSMCLAAFLGIVQLTAPMSDLADRRNELGGAIGFMMAFPFAAFLSASAGYIMLSAMFIAGLFITFEPDLPAIFRSLTAVKEVKQKRMQKAEQQEEDDDDLEQELAQAAIDLIERDSTDAPDINIVRPAFAVEQPKPSGKAAVQAVTKAKTRELLEMKDTRFEEWKFPEMELLDDKRSELTVDDKELKRQAARIKEKLGEFEVEVTMKDAHPGPTVTQFTLQPAEGIKLSKIEGLKNDLALALAAQSLRIEAPIPGKALVGIEMPNEIRSTVYLREMLESPQFKQSASPLTIPLGRGVSGDAYVATIEDMPHLLIAGATGAGKSVAMNTFLISLLFQNAPHELKFILIDPKRVELMPYNGIPHLLTPVITESEKALQALRWAIAEMGRRLHRFSETGVRNLAEFNDKQTEEEKKLPRIVIVIDELADLMMRQHRKDTETMIARIAQMARAVGMHLVIATQRPSVDVITGLIKANIPTRIAFRVVSQVDSRTILDSIGAEDLLGKGDMLYMTASTPKPVRIQGIYVSTKEIERVINVIKIAGGGMFTEEITLGNGEQDENGAVNGATGTINLDADDNGGDDLFFEAVRVVQETGKASASLLQRQLKVGYARAARLLDIMEEKNIIGPSDGAKARKVYIDKLAEPETVQ